MSLASAAVTVTTLVMAMAIVVMVLLTFRFRYRERTLNGEWTTVTFVFWPLSMYFIASGSVSFVRGGDRWGARRG